MLSCPLEILVVETLKPVTVDLLSFVPDFRDRPYRAGSISENSVSRFESLR